MPAGLVKLRVNDGGAIAELAEYPNLMEQAKRRAVNRTGQWIRTRTVEAIVGHIAIKKSDLSSEKRYGGVKFTPAKSDLTAKVVISGNRIPLWKFSGLPRKFRYPLAGISYQILAGGGRKSIKEQAFVATMKSGHVGFMRRIGKGPRIRIMAQSGKRKGRMISSELGLAELYGPSLPHVAEQDPGFQHLLEVDAEARLELQTAREVSFILTGTSKISGDGGDDA